MKAKIMNVTVRNQLNVLIEHALPALAANGVTYNENKNIFLTNGYTSQAGNTYFQGIRLSNRLIISYNIGQGYCHSFLNGITIYGYDGSKKRLISSRSFNCRIFNEAFATDQCKEIVSEYIKSQVKLTGSSITSKQLEDFSNALIAETIQKQLN
ncbi:MAG: hypothetical protein ACRCZY_04455 [Phocaeicola sp.]